MHTQHDTPDDEQPVGRPCAGARCDNLLREWEIRARRELCGQCGSRMAAWMREIPEQMGYLRALRERGRGGNGGRTGTKTAPLPGDETVLNLLGPSAPVGAVVGEADDQHGPLPVHETLYQCMVPIRRARDLEGPQGNTAELIAAWMEPHMEWAAGHDWAVDVQHTLDALMRTLRGVTRREPRTYLLRRPCPRCHELGLRAQDHDDKIECGVCGNRYTESELQDDAPITLARLQREWNEQQATEEAVA